MNTLLRLLSTGTLLCTSVTVRAQDLLGVSWSGATFRISSFTGAASPLGMALPGLNCLARSANGTFWGVRRVSGTFHSLVTIDPATGGATTVASCADIRGLSNGPGTSLYGIRDSAGNDQLVTINTANGAVSTVGGTGFDGLQGLALHRGTLYAWDVFAGLLIVDPATGAAVDPFPAVSGPAYQQSLCSHPDGRLLLGGGDSAGPDSLHVVDVTTGAATLIGAMTGSAIDVRGIESLAGFTASFGQGCNGVFGPVSLSVTGLPRSGGSLTAVSTNHAPNSIGLAVIGGSATSFAGAPLPLLLDPLLGTSNCRLYTSIDLNFAMLSGPTGPATMQLGIAVPGGASGVMVYMQHLCLEAVAGGMSWSDAVTVRIE
jgi:hypothetical protein